MNLACKTFVYFFQEDEQLEIISSGRLGDKMIKYTYRLYHHLHGGILSFTIDLIKQISTVAGFKILLM